MVDYPTELFPELDVSEMESAEEVAKAIHEHLVECCELSGLKPDIEVQLEGPDTSDQYREGISGWLVGWESGPLEWAIKASTTDKNPLNIKGLIDNPHVLAEPYYRFDLVVTNTHV